MLVEKCSTWWLGWLAWFGFTNKADANVRFQNMSSDAENTCFEKVHLHPKPTRRINVPIGTNSSCKKIPK